MGGPIKKNKAFFFYNYSGLRNRLYQVNQLTIPGPRCARVISRPALTFDASGICVYLKGTQLYNPFTGNPFPNNKIPSNLITSQAQKLNAFLPKPTQTTNAAGVPSGGNNYFGLVGAAQTVNEMNLRLDYQISGKDQLYGVYTRNVGDPLLDVTPGGQPASLFTWKTMGGLSTPSRWPGISLLEQQSSTAGQRTKLH